MDDSSKDNPLGCARCKFPSERYHTHTQWCNCGATMDCEHPLCSDCKDEIDVRLADRCDRAEETIDKLIAENKTLRAALKDKE